MAVHWQVKFRAQRSDTLYTVSIYQDYYTGSIVQLTGAANPFETQEDDSDDAFKPVRTQSGYLRIVDNGYAADGVTPFNWRDLVPTTDLDRPVVLSHEDEYGDEVIDWMGTMQAQNFGSRMYEDVIEREFPVQCPLTVMSCSNVMTVNNQRIRNFAEMLLLIMNRIPYNCCPTRFVFQGGADAKDWLLKKLDWYDFIEQDRNFAAKGKYNMGEILEHMCKFWGWTARTMGDTLYFTCPDDLGETYALVFTSSTQLGQFADGQNVGQVGVMFTTNNIGGIYSTVENMDYQDRGPNTVIVKVDSNATGNIVDPFDAELVKEMNGAGTWNEGTTEDNGTDYWHYTKSVYSLTRCDLIGFADPHTSHSPQWYGASFNILSKMNPAPTYGYNEVGNVIHINRTYNGFTFMSFETVYEHCFSDGFFRIFADTYREGSKYESGNFFAGNPSMKMKLGVGWTRDTAQWWNGQAWQSTECEFLASIGNKKPELFTRWQVSANSYDETSIIETGTSLYGCLFVDLLGSDDSRLPDINGQKSFDLLNFRIEFQKNDNVTKQQYPNSEWWDIKENINVPELEYEASNSNMVDDEYNVDCIYGSNDGIQPGFGILMNADCSWMSTAQYGNDSTNQQRPEQHLSTRIADYWAASKRRITCGLLTHEGSDRTIAAELSPRKKIVIDGTTLYPYAISHCWWDDTVDVMAMEMPVATS